MKIKYLPLIAALLMTTPSLVSCLDSNEVVIDYTLESSITSFAVGTLHIDRVGIDSEGKDSAFVDTISFADYPFTIDQTSRIIENKDSLPVGTHTDKVTTTISYDGGYGFLAYEKNGEDTVWTSTDSIDFTNPVKFRVYTYSENSVIKGYPYTVKVNVHQLDPDTLVWRNFSQLFDGGNLTGQQALYADGKVFVLGTHNGTTLMQYTDVSSYTPDGWSTVSGIPSDIKPNSAVTCEGYIYFLTTANQLYRLNPSDMNIETVTTDVTVTRLLAGATESSGAVLYACAGNTNGKINLADGTWSEDTQSVTFEEGANFSSTVALSYNDQIHRTTLMIDNQTGNDTIVPIYTRLTNEPWVKINTSNLPVPYLENISMITYDGKLYAFGGASKASGTTLTVPFQYFYSSEDNGLTWEPMLTKVVFPQETIYADDTETNLITESFATYYQNSESEYSCTVSTPEQELNAEGALNPSCIWVVWRDGSMSRGYINRLSFKPKQW